MSRISFKPQKRTASEREADILFSLKVQVERAARETKDGPFRAGMLEVLEKLDRLQRHAAFKTLSKRNRPDKLKPAG